MFTGIVEELGEVKELIRDKDNLNLWISAKMTPELKIDQSVAHNGVCLTVVEIKDSVYKVTAIKETLEKTNFNTLVTGENINLERGMKLGDRLDGHIVQGHVDQIGKCINLINENGSWVFTFSYDEDLNNITIEKGSITVSGTSLTVINSRRNEFSVAIIPYTYENTIFKYLKIGAVVNLEFDVIGKYVKKLQEMKA